MVDTARAHPESSPRELAWQITDTQDYFISESSAYRILKRCDLITSPAYIVMSAQDRVSGRLVRFCTLSGAFLTRVEVPIERRAVDTKLLRQLTY